MRVFLFVAACLVLVSCFDKGDCLFSNTNFLQVAIKDQAAPSKAKSVEFLSIHIPGEGILYQDTTMNTVYLLVDPRATETTYVFQYDVRSDTLVLGYSSQTIVLSPDCGSYNYQNDLEVKYSTFGTDRVVITNSRLLMDPKTKALAVNIEIFM